MSQSNGTLNVRVTHIEQVTPEIKRFTLASTDGAHLTHSPAAATSWC